MITWKENGPVLWFFLLIFLLPTVASSEPASRLSSERYDVKQWTTDTGLPQNTIQCLLQTRDGYLWIGTRAGLARFDGVKIRVFNAANTPEMHLSDNCICMTEDESGRLWVGTKNGVVSYKHGEFQRLDVDTFPNVAQAKSVCAIATSKDGGLWVSTEFGIQRWKTGVWRMMTNFPSKYLHPEANGGIHNRVNGTRIVEEGNGSVWLGGSQGLFHSLDGKEIFEQVPGIQEGDAPYLGAQRLTKRSRGGLWFWNANGIFLHVEAEPKASWKTVQDHLPYILGSDTSDGLWVRSLIYGIGHFDGARVTWIKTPADFPIRDIELGYEDREGNLWLGSNSYGLFRLKPRVLINYTIEDGLSSNSTWSVSQAPDGTVWVGAEPGLNAYRNGKWEAIHKHLKPEDDPASAKFVSALADSKGVVWLGREYLQKYSEGEFTTATVPGSKEPTIWGARTIYQAHNGDLWVSSGPGLVQIRDNEWRFKFKGRAHTFNLLTGVIQNSTNPASSLTYEDVVGFVEDRSGSIWAGGREGNVARIKGEIIEIFGQEKGIPSGVVGPVLAEHDGAVWFVSSAGILRWKNGHFSHLTKQQGLPEDIVLNILEDDFGNFWLNGHHGIHRARKKDLQMAADGLITRVKFTSFDEADGMLRSEGNGESFPNSCKTRDGRLWFPTMGGVVVIDPRRIMHTTNGIPVIIEQVLADDEPIWGEGIAKKFPEGKQSGLHDGPTGRSQKVGQTRIRLEPGRARVLKIRYTAPATGRAEKVQFQYRLRGQDEKWVRPEPDTDRVAYYTNLQPGDYNFEIQADDTFGAWGTPAVFSFVLAPHFWETRAFYMICVSAISGMALALHQSRLRVQRRIAKLEQQHALDQERARIARDMHDDLGATLTKIQFLSVRASRADNGQAGINEQFLTIAQTAREATQGMDEIVWAVNPRNDRLENLAYYLGRYTEEFLKTAGLRYKLNIPAELPLAVMSAEVRYSLFLAVKECLNNIAKHAQAREVQFELLAQGDTLNITITDDGVGFDAARQSGSGDGLRNLPERLSRFGGTVAWESDGARGTRVKIRTPLMDREGPHNHPRTNEP